MLNEITDAELLLIATSMALFGFFWGRVYERLEARPRRPRALKTKRHGK
jgi:hypothetical protein